MSSELLIKLKYNFKNYILCGNLMVLLQNMSLIQYYVLSFRSLNVIFSAANYKYNYNFVCLNIIKYTIKLSTLYIYFLYEQKYIS